MVGTGRPPAVLVVGVGPHARRTHLPLLTAARESGLVGQVVGVDLERCRPELELLNGRAPGGPIPLCFVPDFHADLRTLPAPVAERLDALVAEHGISAVIVATEPSFHVVYALWALARGLHVLVDKPVSVTLNASLYPERALGILADVQALEAAYERARQRHPGLYAGVLTQRRHHPVYLRARELLAEVAAETGCPVTSVQSFHSDGQWRLPGELVDIDYHSYERGYGKCAHSGYHFFDLVPWLIESSGLADKLPDEVEVVSTFSRPLDFLDQIRFEDYRRIFPGFDAATGHSERQIRERVAGYGEMDAFVSLDFRRAGRSVALGSVNLLHNGFSRRPGLISNLADLYTGNGRVRHEGHTIMQGPFQAVYIQSTYAGEHDGEPDPHARGGRRHIDLQVFRNSGFDPRWRSVQTFDSRDFDGASQEAARAEALGEFLAYLGGRRSRAQMTSELPGHRSAATLLAGAYLSAARRWQGQDPVARLGLGSNFGRVGAPVKAA